ncbi:MAG: hypothetical protein ACOYT8_01340 [Candidatus Dependentiae bacterium]
MNYFKTISFFLILCIHLLHGMEENLAELAYQCNAQQLEKVITPESLIQCDKHGISLFMHAVSGVFEHKRFDDFEKTILLFKKHNFNCNAPLNSKTEFTHLCDLANLSIKFTHLCYLANLSIDFYTLIPLKIVLKHGANPFENDLSVFEQMKVLSKDIPYASCIADEMALYANNLHDAAKGVCVPAMSKFVNNNSVNAIDNKGATPLYYVIQYAEYANKKNLAAAIKLLKDHGTNVNDSISVLKEIPGSTYMHYATLVSCKNKNLDLIEAMLENGGSPLAGIGNFPIAPIHFAEFMALKKPFYKKIFELYSNHLKNNK